MDEPWCFRASAALAACVEALAEGRRVVVFGDSSSGLAALLLGRGARLIHVYDPEPERVAEAAARNRSRNVTLAPLPEGGLAVRDGAFDLALVEDLAELPRPAEIMGYVRRALGPRGVAVVASRNPDATVSLLQAASARPRLQYETLYDLVAAEFDQVTMYGQTPFVGYAVAAFGVEDPVPVFDTGLVPGGAEQSEWYWAVAGAEASPLEDFTIVQLPLAAIQRPDPAPVEDRALRDELGRRDQWIEELEARSTAADARADQAQSDLDDLQAELQAARAELEARAKAEGARSDQTRREIDALRSERDQLKSQIATLSGFETQAAEDVARLEAQLAARGDEVQRLQRDLREAERVGKDLVRELEDRPTVDPMTADLVAKLDALASLNARREGELAAARYQIEALKADLEDLTRSRSGAGPD